MSAHRLKLAFTENASSDIANILLHSFNRWGPQQRDRYAQLLSTALDKLTVFPQLGKDCSHHLPGLRAHRFSQHVAYYLINPDGILILRILHTKWTRPRISDHSLKGAQEEIALNDRF